MYPSNWLKKWIENFGDELITRSATADRITLELKLVSPKSGHITELIQTFFFFDNYAYRRL